MPITKDRFDRISERDAHLDSDADRLLDFLIRHEDKAYTKSEIAEETSVAKENVGPVLDRLRERGSVEHKSEYWRVSDHELAARAGTRLTAATARQYDDGDEFDVEKWAEYAVGDVEWPGETE
ncbi:MarR family transcriptional regulator [Halorussus lipolyticus]|uniref:MarR family transcriptional regulator n=1 Tax=Halorussus lipolyticus TaxID=3034024 RepID=UPI0023E835F5|nr:MarR family transcriptional regulator [Halorussus sp. DT80]